MSDQQANDAVQAVARELRLALARLAGQPLPASQFLTLARRLVRRFEPLMSRALRDALLRSYLDAAQRTAASVPPPPSPPPFFPFAPPAGEPIVRLPMIEAAVESLLRRNLITPSGFRPARPGRPPGGVYGGPRDLDCDRPEGVRRGGRGRARRRDGSSIPAPAFSLLDEN